MSGALLAALDLLRRRIDFDAGQVFLQCLVTVGRADEQKISAAGQDRLAQGLVGMEVVAEINGVKPPVAFGVGEEPAARGAAFTVLFVKKPTSLTYSKRRNMIDPICRSERWVPGFVGSRTNRAPPSKTLFNIVANGIFVFAVVGVEN
jgi:hypothetical protein